MARSGRRGGQLRRRARAARTRPGPSPTRPPRSRPVAHSPARGARRRSSASSGKTSDDDRQLHDLDADVEDQQRPQQRPRPGLVDARARRRSRGRARGRSRRPREPRPARAVEAEVAARRCRGRWRARPRRQSRHRYQPATTAIDSAMIGSTTADGTSTRPSAASMNVTEWASVKRRRREHDLAQPPRPGDQRQQEQDVVDAGEQVLGAELEELPEPLARGLLGGERRLLGVERGAARPSGRGRR